MDGLFDSAEVKTEIEKEKLLFDYVRYQLTFFAWYGVSFLLWRVSYRMGDPFAHPMLLGGAIFSGLFTMYLFFRLVVLNDRIARAMQKGAGGWLRYCIAWLIAIGNIFILLGLSAAAFEVWNPEAP